MSEYEQLDLVELLETSNKTPQFILERRHFDDIETNPRFVAFLHMNGARIGEQISLHNFQVFILENLRDFKRLHDMKEDERMGLNEQAQFTEYLMDVANGRL